MWRKEYRIVYYSWEFDTLQSFYRDLLRLPDHVRHGTSGAAAAAQEPGEGMIETANQLLARPATGILLTVASYLLGVALFRRFRWSILQPLIVAVRHDHGAALTLERADRVDPRQVELHLETRQQSFELLDQWCVAGFEFGIPGWID